MFEEDQRSLSGKLDELKSSVDLLHEVLSRLDSEVAGVHQRLVARIGQLESRLHQEDSLGGSGAVGGKPSSGIEAGDLNELIRRLSVGTNQEEILEIFLEESQSYVQRAILFLHQDNRFVPWKSLGFPSEAINDVETSIESDPIVRAARQRRIIHRTDGLEEVFPWLVRAGEMPMSAICIPLVFDDVVPVVLYADHREHANLDSLELLTHLTLLHLKNNYLLHLSSAGGEPTEDTALAAPKTAVEEPARVEAELPETPAAETSPATFHEGADFETEGTAGWEKDRAPEADPTEELEKESFSMAEPAEGPAASEFEPEGSAESTENTVRFEPPPSPAETDAEETKDEVEEEVVVREESEEEEVDRAAEGEAREAAPVLSEEEQREHNEARRFARLLVSEIKLYNEEQVQKGRDRSDLYSRLRGDIDRSREMYEKRVHPDIAASSDYFHEEVVRILAGGSDGVLGEEYPGPRHG